MPSRHRCEAEVYIYPYSNPELEDVGDQQHAPYSVPTGKRPGTFLQEVSKINQLG